MLTALLLSSVLTFVQLNCENLFDTRHDSLKQDNEFLPEGVRHWSNTRYWNKVNHVGQTLLSCSKELPSLVALCEVENDSVLIDLTRRSLLRRAGYEYLMTRSADRRGIDVALLYQPYDFTPLCYECIEVPLLQGMRPTRDILYVKGLIRTGDTLHVFVVHAPSRYGGEQRTRPFRMQVVRTLRQFLEAEHLTGNILVAGDFNDYASSRSLKELEHGGLVNIGKHVKGRNGVGGTYRHRGDWHSLDHVLLSPDLVSRVDTVYINDASFLLIDEPVYGGSRPRRTFNGMRYEKGGFSDHLPLVVRLRWE